MNKYFSQSLLNWIFHNRDNLNKKQENQLNLFLLTRLFPLRNQLIQTLVAVVEICTEAIPLFFPKSIGCFIVFKNKTKDFVDSFCLYCLFCTFHKATCYSLSSEIRMHAQMMNDCSPSVVTGEYYADKLFSRKSTKASCGISFYIYN